MILILNHKSYFTKEKILDYISNYQTLDKNGHSLIVCPNHCYLPYFEGCDLGCQDISSYPSGPYTGSISGETLASFGVCYVLINHSDRAKYFQEDLSVAKKKLEACVRCGLVPIVCIGDTKKQHEDGQYLEVLNKELSYLLNGISSSFLIAYEPIFAIGTGNIPSKEDIIKVVDMIKQNYSCPVLYGGSVDENNVKSFLGIKNLDGFLLGGVSLYLDKLQRLLFQLS